MLKSYLKIAVRNLRKHPLFTFINVVGLAVGLSCCMLIVLYVQDELSYERIHDKADRIVRVVEDQTTEEGHLNRLAITYGPLAPMLREDFANVEDAVRVLSYPMLMRRNDGEKHQEDGILFVDSTFLQVFDFPLLRGDVGTALASPFSVILTPEMAQKYYGDADPIGQPLAIRDDEKYYEFTVTGIVESLPHDTHIQFDFLASFASMRTIYSDFVDSPHNWYHPPLYTYVLLAEGATPENLEAQMPAFVDRRLGERHGANYRSFHVERLTDIRLYSGREQELSPTGDIRYVYLFALIAAFILLLACINFMNLATARATQRAKEVGMRKSLGAARGQLIRQFLAESILLALLAMGLGVLLAEALLPVFNTVAGKALPSGMLARGPIVFGLMAAVCVVGLLAGSYPALYLSRFRPAHVLKGTGHNGTPTVASFRQGLVVFQFVISIALIIGTLVIQRQLHYVQNERLGFDKEHVVLVPLRDIDNQYHHESIKQAWEALPGVEHVSAASGMPGLEDGLSENMITPELAAVDSLMLMTLTVDHDYVDTYGLKIIAGRDFSEDFPSDSTSAFLINEAAALRLGWQDPVGKQLSLNVWFDRHFDKSGTIVGVVEDFQYRSLRQNIEPMIFHILPNSYYYDYLAARLSLGYSGSGPEQALQSTLTQLEETWTRFNPERPFEYTFLDDQFDALYRTESRMAHLFGLFSILAVVIACLGLFGLAAFTADQRTKEIGVRKVLGATVPNLVLLLSKDFLRLVFIAFIIATPLAYLGMQRWLNDFAARIDLGADVFLVAGGLALVIALLTVSFQAVKAALADPVHSLRSE